MPIITIEGPCLSTDQKRQLVRDLTKAARAVIPLPAEAFIVLIKRE